MPNLVKFLIGLAAALGAGWVSHAPMGRGEAFAAQLDAQVQAVLSEPMVAIPGVTAQVQREPLARRVILSGPANCFQRNGQGSLPGLDGRVSAIPGVAGVEWSNEPPEGPCR